MKLSQIINTFFIAALCACNAKSQTNSKSMSVEFSKLPKTSLNIADNHRVIILGGGCFWCTEAIYLQLRGIISAESGYAGGHVANPSYEAVCDKQTGHAEVVKVVYDPKIISLDDVLEVFFEVHDPTTLNRQGNDVGPQYRSVIYFQNDEERQIAEDARVKAQEFWDSPIVTEITPFSNFYKAEAYHQNYYFQNSNQPYCAYVITPKVKKFQKIFSDKLKQN
jgi:peptide-methionine (S)-S-oxide reductase